MKKSVECRVTSDEWGMGMRFGVGFEAQTGMSVSHCRVGSGFGYGAQTGMSVSHGEESQTGMSVSHCWGVRV